MLIQTHRDPLRVVPSVSSLEYTGRGIASDAVDPRKIGHQQLRLWSTLLSQGLRARVERPHQAHQIFDLHFQEIVADPLGCVRRVYAHFDLELTPETLKRMQTYLDAHPRDVERRAEQHLLRRAVGRRQARAPAVLPHRAARHQRPRTAARLRT